jgi:2-polyprenyl-3-methyl-5-hydroxy-6-metoxy-1,4-benzoquinol methylase
MMPLIEKIKQKKEFQDLPDSLVEESLSKYLKKHSISLKALSPKQQKLIVKEIRSQLRQLTGQYQISPKKRLSLLQKNKIQELLNTHQSTKERLPFYPKLKSLLKKLKVSSVLDLACGLNPLALASSSLTYHASDIKQSELDLIKTYFHKNKIKGTTFILDLQNIPTKTKFPKTDITLILKTLDLLKPKQKITSHLLEKINSPLILISFPTNKLSGHSMQHKRRPWLERILKTQGLNYKTFESNNEIFYLIEKS